MKEWSKQKEELEHKKQVLENHKKKLINNGHLAHILLPEHKEKEVKGRNDWSPCFDECLEQNLGLSQTEQTCLEMCVKKRNLFLPKLLSL